MLQQKKWLQMDNNEKLDAINAIAEILLPEAKEIVIAAENDKTTKDGYGTVLKFLSGFNEQPFYCKAGISRALIMAGYPSDVLKQVMEINGWSIQ